MAQYRFFTVSKSGAFTGVHVRDCERPEDIRPTAEHLLRNELGNVSQIEVWAGPRKVCTVVRPAEAAG